MSKPSIDIFITIVQVGWMDGYSVVQVELGEKAPRTW